MTNFPSLKVSDLAEKLGVSSQVIWTWVRKGLVPFYGLPGGYRFEETEILSWIESKKKTPRQRVLGGVNHG